MRKLKIVLFFFLLLSSHCIWAQDSTRTLHAEQFLQLVRQYHPIIKQASIYVEKTKADITLARSAFDPILSTYVAQKTFDGNNYYNYFSPEIVIPVWYGIEVHSGIENLTGNRLDPTETKGKTSFVGVSVPLLKDLVIDKRRAFLRQAKIMHTMAEVEQRAVVNNLLMEAIEQYWAWVRAYQRFLVIQKNVVVNTDRLALVKMAYFNGERPAIDTIEALTQLQTFQSLENEALLELKNTHLQLSAYLWKANQTPYELPDNVTPREGWDDEKNISQFNLNVLDLLAIAEDNHPDLQHYTYKLDILAIDKKLKFQSLLPKLDFRYNQLGKGYNLLQTTVNGPLFENNFQYGLKLEMPLTFAQGRGDYRNAKLKIQDAQLDQQQKRLQIAIKIKSYHNEFLNLKEQIALQRDNYQSYLQLLRAEEIRFSNGESALFLVNSRESKTLEALDKLIALKTKYFKTLYALQWSAGILQ